MGSPPIPFPGANNVPIIGAICTFHDVQPDVLISCTCDGPIADRLIRFKAWGTVGLCRACKRTMVIKQLTFNSASQQVQIEIIPVVRAAREPGNLEQELADARETLASSAFTDGAKPS